MLATLIGIGDAYLNGGRRTLIRIVRRGAWGVGRLLRRGHLDEAKSDGGRMRNWRAASRAAHV